MGGNAKTTQFLKECMADALIMLLKEKPFEKITVPEITDLAGVGRATYFRHFSKKEDLLIFKLTLLQNRWQEENVPKNVPQTVEEGMYHFFRFHADIRDLIKTIYERGLQFTVYQSFYRTLVPKQEDKILSYKSRFFSYAVLGMMDEWVNNDFRETPEELANLVSQFARL